MNRRSFFGLACGGLVAAPLALVGEKPASSEVAVAVAATAATAVTPVGQALRAPIIINVVGASGDEHVRDLVRRGIRRSLDRFSGQLRR
jgi:outer membrane receptor protein involved in Fe transport